MPRTLSQFRRKSASIEQTKNDEKVSDSQEVLVAQSSVVSLKELSQEAYERDSLNEPSLPGSPSALKYLKKSFDFGNSSVASGM